MRSRDPNQRQTSTGSPPISRVTPQSNVIPFDGLFTMPISFFQPSIVAMICCDPRLIGAGGSFGWSAMRTPAFSASGMTALRKYVMLVHISSSVCAPSSGSGGRSFMRS